MKVLAISSILIAQAVIASAETVTTTDGRKFELKGDGTYELVADKTSARIQLVEQLPFFEHFAGEYNQNSMRFMPIFQNETGKTVVGFRFRTVFKSPFGDEVFAFDGESSEKFAPGSASTASAFFYFEDNQFIGDEPYDKLSIFKASGTGKIESAVTAVVFDDGEVTKIDP